jgi:hypothetical protein
VAGKFKDACPNRKQLQHLDFKQSSQNLKLRKKIQAGWSAWLKTPFVLTGLALGFLKVFTVEGKCSHVRVRLSKLQQIVIYGLGRRDLLTGK